MSQNQNSPFAGHILRYNQLAYLVLRGRDKKILDLGCGDGTFIGNIGTKAGRVYGYDVDRQKIIAAKKQYQHVEFALGHVGEPLPYQNNFFDVVCMFHVLEHVDSEARIISEAYRVLHKDGTLIIGSPYKGLFTFADIANLRYRFPKLHQWFGHLFFGKETYYKIFVANKSRGLFGDSSINRSWHKHYKESEIRKLLRGKFSITRFEKYSLSLPFLFMAYNAWHKLFKCENRLINWLIEQDNKLHLNELSYNMFIVAKRQ